MRIYIGITSYEVRVTNLMKSVPIHQLRNS